MEAALRNALRLVSIALSLAVGIAIVADGKTAVTEFTVRIEGLDYAHEGNMLDSFGT